MIVIIGAGPTGLSAARRLQACGQDWLLLEAEDSSGGLSRSFQDALGFTWDLGGHIEFSRYAEFDQCFDSVLADTGWVSHTRSTQVLFESGKSIPFPVQYNLHRFPDAQMQACLDGLVEASEKPKGVIRNYEEWIDSALGVPFKEIFLEPYTRKIWNKSVSELDYVWVDEKIAIPRLADVRKSISLNEDYTQWGPTYNFRYPKKGGMGAIWQAVVKDLPKDRLKFGKSVSNIDVKSKEITASDGNVYAYSAIISTMPLDLIVKLVDAPGIENSRRAAEDLEKSSVHVVGLGFQGEVPSRLKGVSWLYNADDTQDWFRLTVLSNLSECNVPSATSHWSVLVEIADIDKQAADQVEIVQCVLTSLIDLGFIFKDVRPISTFYHWLDHGYPIPFLGRDAVVDPILRYLEGLDIFSRGRFGAWRYEVSNQDHSFMQGIEVVDRILRGAAEVVIETPHRLYPGNRSRSPS